MKGDAANDAREEIVQAAIEWEQNPSPHAIKRLNQAVIAYKKVRSGR